MTKKEKLIFEMQKLVDALNDYLHVLEKEETDEKAYQQLGEGMFSVIWALRYYNDEELIDSANIATHDPDVQGMDFE